MNPKSVYEITHKTLGKSNMKIATADASPIFFKHNNALFIKKKNLP